MKNAGEILKMTEENDPFKNPYKYLLEYVLSMKNFQGEQNNTQN